MQEMQEQFFVMSKDGLYAGNAGAIFCYVQGWTVCKKCRSNFLSIPKCCKAYRSHLTPLTYVHVGKGPRSKWLSPLQEA
jgi:hypothetical protein